MVCGKGINDMPYGWAKENEWNNMVYLKWSNMLVRCYSENFHKKYPSYKECIVCNRWLSLSNFVEDFKSIDGYDKEKFIKGELELAKDIKSNGVNKEYSLENCKLVNHNENAKQANKTRDYSFMQGENNSCSIKIEQYDKKTNELVKIWNSSKGIELELNINNGNIIKGFEFWEIDCNKEKWFKTYKAYPYKSTGGYRWKYYKENDKN